MSGGALEHSRQWLGAQRPGLSRPWEHRATQSRQARPEKAQEPNFGLSRGGGGVIACCAAVSADSSSETRFVSLSREATSSRIMCVMLAASAR